MADDIKATPEDDTVEELPVEELDNVSGGFERAMEAKPEILKI